MSLYICEKPSQARDIATVMGITSKGDGVIHAGSNQVTWCIGHLLEMDDPESYDSSYKKWNMADLPILPEAWKMHVKKTVSKQYGIVSKLVKNTDSIVVATDADREGECIAREIIDRVKYTGEINRLWLRALDTSSIKKALASIQDGSTTEQLYHAALGRQRADWMVGMNMSRAYTILGRQKGLDSWVSVGRVQTPTLALVVNRDRAIDNFTPVPFYVNWIKVESDNGHFTSSLVTTLYKDITGFDSDGRCLEENVAKLIAQKCTGTANVTQADYGQKASKAPLPFSLSSLQQTCNKLWGYGAKVVLDIAQALYEKHKLTTYPRSDCNYLPSDQLADASSILEAIKGSQIFDSDILNQIDSSQKSRAWNDKKITAHHAIIPNSSGLSEANLNEKELNVYKLICKHYVVQFLPDYLYLQSTIILKAADFSFRASGKTPVSMGWKAIFDSQKTRSNKTDQELPKVNVGDDLPISESSYDHKKTTPPKPFDEGALIAAMSNIQQFIANPELKKILKETEGIGTEATRASIIETLFKRKFLSKKGKQVRSTELAKSLIDILPNDLKDPGTTALMERMLGQIADSTVTLDDFMSRQTTWLSKLVERAKDEYDDTPSAANSLNSNKSFGECPECTEPLRERPGKYGKFIGCSGYPDCKYILKNTKPPTSSFEKTSQSGIEKYVVENN